jgi:flagellar hook protein FlgE
MMRSLYAASSGVKGHQSYLEVTSNNIANVNTVGYKRDQLNFADMLAQIIKSSAGPVTPPGGIDPSMIGLGSSIASISPCFAQGSLQQTGAASDMAIEGDGFFIVRNGYQQLYTRAGNFCLDDEGNLLMQGNGYKVQGYAITNGVKSDVLSPVNLPTTRDKAARATEIAAFRCNLDAADDARINPLAIASGEDYVTRPFAYSSASDLYASASSVTSAEGLSEFGASMIGSHDWADSFDVYDSSGNAHKLNIAFRHAADRTADTDATPPRGAESEWDWYAYYIDSSGRAIPADGQGAGTLVFGDDGQLSRTYALDPSSMTFVERDASEATGNPTGLVSANFNGTGGTSQISLDFLGRDYASVDGRPYEGTMGSVTNFAADSTTRMKGQDGYASGKMTDWSVDSLGVIHATYSNLQTEPIAQLAVARFINPQGLYQAGDACFTETNNSGGVIISTAGQHGMGYIEDGAIEMSNVDLSDEFVNMIRAQRGLQANSRAITVSDQMLETVLGIKR